MPSSFEQTTDDYDRLNMPLSWSSHFSRIGRSSPDRRTPSHDLMSEIDHSTT
jgi:hypothetical protein